MQAALQHTQAHPTRQPPESRASGDASIQALYLHVPFCIHKCHYCDFYSTTTLGDDLYERFTTRLIAELRHHHRYSPLRPYTVFVGGGTPTLLPARYWGELLGVMRELDVLDRCVEFTVEANPDTVDRELLDGLAAGGVNRLSIGAQSFNADALRVLERHHDPENVSHAVTTARAAGITNVSLDLIFAVPGQSLDTLHADLDAALALEPNHLSTYGLTYEPNTPLTARLRAGQIERADEELEAEMYRAAIARLADADFEHYEVSNWAGPRPISPGLRPGATAGRGQEAGITSDENTSGHRPRAEPGANGWLPDHYLSGRPYALHNLLYWHNANWLGLGPAAASHLDGHRWRNQPNLQSYLQGDQGHPASADWRPPTNDHETLKPAARIGEQLMLRLRLRRGVPLTWLEDHLAIDDFRRGEITYLTDAGLLEHTDDHLRLTPQGLMVADSVLARLL